MAALGKYIYEVRDTGRRRARQGAFKFVNACAGYSRHWIAQYLCVVSEGLISAYRDWSLARTRNATQIIQLTLGDVCVFHKNFKWCPSKDMVLPAICVMCVGTYARLTPHPFLATSFRSGSASMWCNFTPLDISSDVNGSFSAERQ